MQVQCFQCKKDYQLDIQRLPPRGLIMRCPHCETRMRVTPDGKVAAATELGIKPTLDTSNHGDLPAPKQVEDLPGLRTAHNSPTRQPIAPPPVAKPADRSSPFKRSAFGMDSDLPQALPKEITDLPGSISTRKSAFDSTDSKDIEDLPTLAESHTDLPTPSQPNIDLPRPSDPLVDLPSLKPEADDLDLDLESMAPKAPAKARRMSVPIELVDPEILGFSKKPIANPKPVEERVSEPAAQEPEEISANVSDLDSGLGDFEHSAVGQDETRQLRNSDFGALDLEFELPEGETDHQAAGGATEFGRSFESPQDELGDFAEGGDENLEASLGDDSELEMDELPEAEIGSSLPAESVEGMPYPAPMNTKAKMRRLVIKIAGAAAVIGVIAGAGFALESTRFGLFGMHVWERWLPSGGNNGEVQALLKKVETKNKADTYGAFRDGILQLGKMRADAGANRLLLSRSLLLESIYKVRFGGDPKSDLRSERIATRLQRRGNDAPGIQLSLAANLLRQGKLGQAQSELQKGKAESAKDPYMHWLAGEIALNKAEYDKAIESYEKMKQLGGGAMAEWGLTRAYQASGQQDKYVAGIEQVLQLSPMHAEARLAKSLLLLEQDKFDEAYAILRDPAGYNPDTAKNYVLNTKERTDVLTTIGFLEEKRNHPGAAIQAYTAATKLDPANPRANIRVGNLLLEQGNTRDALTRFRALLNTMSKDDEVLLGSTRPWSVEAKLGAVQALLSMGKTEDAYQTLRGLDTKYPQDAEVIMWFAKTSALAGDRTSAAEQFQKAIDLAPNDIKYYIAFSQFYFDLDQSNDAFRVLKSAEGKVDMSAKVRTLRGDAEMRRNHYSDAIAEYEAALALEPNSASANFGMAAAYRRSGRTQDALQKIETVAAIDPKYPGLDMERGKLLEALGRFDEAIASYRKTLINNPDAWQVKSRLGAALVQAGELDEAKTLLEEVLVLQPNYPEAEHYLGRIALKRGLLPEAKDHFERASRVEPAEGIHRMYLGWVALEGGNLGTASETIRAALEKDPNLGDAYWLRARLRAQMGQVKDALKDVQRALEINPSRTDSYAVMATCFAQLGRYDDAVASYKSALRYNPDNAQYWFVFGRLYYDHGDFAAALDPLNRSIQLALDQKLRKSWIAEAYRLTASLYEKKGQRDQAIARYREYLNLPALSQVSRQEVIDELKRLGFEYNL